MKDFNELKSFEDWWENEGQYNRAGGGEYEKDICLGGLESSAE